MVIIMSVLAAIDHALWMAFLMPELERPEAEVERNSEKRGIACQRW